MQSLRSKAAAISGESLIKFAAGEAKVGAGFQTVYAHVQCTNDLSELECNECLTGGISHIPTCCNGKIRSRIFTPSCNLRYDTHLYFDSLSDLPPQPSLSPAPSSPTATATPKQGKNNSSSATVTAIVVPMVSLVIVLFITFVCIYFKRKKKKPTKYSESQGASEADYEIEPIETLQFHFQTIMDATNNFSIENKLGEGGFGLVYKGRLPNGKEVAVKRLSRTDQGDIEFMNELLLVAKLQHRNLVRLLGFCLETGERILVYEFLPNKSLDYFIFGNLELLLGYSAVLALHGLFSIKSDVFSFGVLLLDIVSGHKNGDIHNGEYVEHLISFTWRKWREGFNSASDIVDPTLNSRFGYQIMRCIHIGLLCVQENLADRPTMATVVVMLNSDSLALPMPSRAAYVITNNSGDLSNSSRLGESRNYALQAASGANEASFTELHPR
ncbi:Cysteine-rich receptor-like protein kinase [Arachis hypogaea]|nr:Cysteine-rich receptor-like protein kinase [Arachis hypogaea]